MNPTLDESDLLEVVCCRGGSVRLGDVVLFLPPAYATPVVHRVIRLTPAGIITRGDNNDREDPWPLQPAQILGRVVVARRGAARRRIWGGRAGFCMARLARRRRALEGAISRPLHPLYHRLAASGVIYRLAPAWARPRLVVFTAGDERRALLLLRRRIVGQYDLAKRRWRIRRPFRLLIDPQFLAAEAGQDGTSPAVGPLASAM